MANEKIPQSLRIRLNPLFRELVAFQWVEGLDHNRISGAVFQKLQQPEFANLTEDQAVDAAVNMTRKERLPELLAWFDARIAQKGNQARRQVEGIVNNLIPKDTPDRDRVIQETLDMIDRHPLIRSISGIRRLVQARVNNGNKDFEVDIYEFLS